MSETDDTEQSSAAGLIPNEPMLDELREAAAGCTACPLYRNATQTVFGEGPEPVRIMFVGEQPGDPDATVHPSSLLRTPDEETRHREMELFIEDLKKIAEVLRSAK